MDFSCSTLLCFGVVLGFLLFGLESSPVLVHQSLDCLWWCLYEVVVVSLISLWGGLVVICWFAVLLCVLVSRSWNLICLC